MLDWVGGWFSPEEAPDSEPEPANRRPLGVWGTRALVYGPAALLLLVLIVLMTRWGLASMRARDRALPDEGQGPRIARAGAAPGETSPDAFWARAETLAAQGRFKPAIRELLLGAMSAIERRGLIRHRQGLTNRDYLSATRGPMRASFDTLAAAFERVYFGRRDATEETFRKCAAAFRQAFSFGPEQEPS